MTLTERGTATRDRIVACAADLVLARGVGGTTLDDIRIGTATSKSQLFHYFPGGKHELVSAIAAFQSERVRQAQCPHLDELDSWASWDAWRAAVVAHYGSQPHWGCPIGALAAELMGNDPQRAAEVAAAMDRWRGQLEVGVRRLRQKRLIRPDVRPKRMSISIFASLQGGLLLTQTAQSIKPLEAALDGALGYLRSTAG